MGIDDTALTIWQTTKPPLGLLMAGRATEMLAAPLSEPLRAPFGALFDALAGWWPRRARATQEIYEHEFRACLDVGTAHEEANPALTGAYVQMTALLKLAPRSLPRDRFYDMGEEDFAMLLRQAAKATRLPLAQLDARLSFVLERAKEREPWTALIARTARMRWERGAPWGKLDKRIRDLASLADLGAEASWVTVGAQKALELRLDGTKRTTVLQPEELAALQSVIPSISEPG